MHESVLVYRRYLYLKAAGLTAVAGLIAYIVHSPVGPANGGTWLGYILGGIGAALIVWLMWFGMRKRTYGAGHVKLEDWLSAHIYLGLALIFVATLHTGFQFSWNVHTLAYALMMVVIASGAFGVFAYIRYPRLMTQNRHGETLDGIMSEIAELDRECRNLSMTLTDEMSAAVLESSQNTRIGGSLLRQLSGRDPHCPTKAAFKTVRRLAGEATPKNADAARNLITLMGKKAFLVRRGRRDVQYKALMDVWLYIHIPLSFALLAALIAHIVSVFILLVVQCEHGSAL